jgi:hypothetical protein
MGDALFQVKGCGQSVPGGGFKKAPSTDHEVGFVRFESRAGRSLDLQGQALGGVNLQDVGEAWHTFQNRRDQLQFMEAIRPPVQDSQESIELGRGLTREGHGQRLAELDRSPRANLLLEAIL